MKMNAPRRQLVRDAVDLIPTDEIAPENGIVGIPISGPPDERHPGFLRILG